MSDSTSRYSTPTKLELFAPAKVNLGLAVTGRLDNGYHTLDTLFVTLDVGDTITLEQSDTDVVHLEVGGIDLPTGPENLVYRAAETYLRAVGVSSGVRIQLEKRLPIAAGLGGGSSDAATTLLGLSRLYPSSVDLPALAKTLGADVPFFLQGGARHAQGIGEILRPVPLPEVHLVLVNPGVHITAREAYIGLNGRFGPPLDVDAILAALSGAEAPPYRNDLEIPVLEAYPVIGTVKHELQVAGLFGVLMSGSGSTCFGLAHQASHALEVAERLQHDHPAWWVRAAKSVGERR
jgi:4-diphosphocytidyl-2-C-methyl-D-erythritol kinase